MYSCTEQVPFSPLCEDMLPARKHSDGCSRELQLRQRPQAPELPLGGPGSPFPKAVSDNTPQATAGNWVPKGLMVLRENTICDPQHGMLATQSLRLAGGQERPTLNSLKSRYSHAFSAFLCSHLNLMSVLLLSSFYQRSPGIS